MANVLSTTTANARLTIPPLPDPIHPFPIPVPPIPVPQPPTFPVPLPLPFPDPRPGPFPPFHFRSVRCGCYLINYTPTASIFASYDGTLRVECHSNGRTASGDLYQRGVITLPPKLVRAPLLRDNVGRIVLASGPAPSAGIPILPRARYRYYLRVTQILENFTIANSFTLGFEMHRFNAATSAWVNEGAFTAQMNWTPAPSGYPSPSDYLVGDVKNAAGGIVGRLTMGWVNRHLRKATVEVDRVAQSDRPLDNGAGVNWQTVGESIGWDITVVESESNLAEPSGQSWSNAECHQAMLAHRAMVNLDNEWRYHVLAVRQLDATPRGIMYDNGATDSNNVPREGCALASHWIIPNDASWGTARGLRFGTVAAAYFRTVVHETGHAMGLYHNTVDLGFMNTTDVIAAAGTAANPFPANIQWSHAQDDQKRLRHMPDNYVRPGGTPFGTAYGATPISPTDLEFEPSGLVLDVKPLLPSVPLGAPVRVDIVLRNTGDEPVEAPSSISLSSGVTHGGVVNGGGEVRSFSPLVLCMDEEPMTVLQPGESVASSLTLLRGADGALFPVPGLHDVRVEVHWDAGGVEASVSGEASVVISAPVDDAHAAAALHVLETPDVLLTLALGGDHLEEGIAAIRAALDNPVLRPHFALIEAKRLSQRFGRRKPDLKAAAELLDEGAVMSEAEISRAAGFVAGEAATSGGKLMAAKLKRVVADREVSDEVKALVDGL